MKFFHTADNQTWNNQLKIFNSDDYFHSYNYHYLFSKYVLKKSEPIMFYNETFCIPLVLRKIYNTDFYDLTSVYGYNGYLLKNDSNIEFIFESFIKFIKNNFPKVITVFFRSYPLQKLVQSKYLSKTNTLALINLLDKNWPINLKQNEKRNIKKLKKIGAIFVQNKGEFEIKNFIQNYFETMKRNKATNFYFFDELFIRNLILRENVNLYSVILDNKIISSAIFLKNSKISHYYLGGTNSLYLKYSPLKLIIYEAYHELKSYSKYINLGSGGENLRHFKLKLSNETNDFYTFKTILNNDIYEYLVKKYGSINNKFFPAYCLNQ